MEGKNLARSFSFRIKSLGEKTLALVALAILSPLFVFAALGIRLSSPGPVFYRAQRVGLHRKVFTMYKFRTMAVQEKPGGSAITAKQDARVFPFGALLRRLKIDELPQLLNVLKGDMSLVGPRPEDPKIVFQYYTPQQLQTLRVLPGLASPGSIYNYTHGEQVLGSGAAEEIYLEKFLNIKLALELVYVREASLLYDVKIILRTLRVILAMSLGRRKFSDPPEMKKAKAFLQNP